MKTTDSQNLGKVNQILSIMQEHFGKSMNLSRAISMASAGGHATKLRFF